MALTEREVWGARRLGLGFVALFIVALTVLLGDVLGLFADPAADFPAHFDTAAERLRHAMGGYALTAAGLAFVGFALRVTNAGTNAAESSFDVQGARLTAAAFASLTGLAAAALTTVSLSIAFGQIVGDPGIRRGQEILPQLGYVVLTVPAALSAATSIWFLARVGSRTGVWPRWVSITGYVAAVAQLVSFYTLPLLLLPVWVLAASVVLRAPQSP